MDGGTQFVGEVGFHCVFGSQRDMGERSGVGNALVERVKWGRSPFNGNSFNLATNGLRPHFN